MERLLIPTRHLASFIVLGFLMLSAVESQSPDNCESGFLKLGGFCYFYQRTAMTWPDARAACQAQNADLASVTSKSEFAVLYQICDSPGYNCWLGANDIDSEGNWVWSDGSDNSLLTSSTNHIWWTGEPNNCCGGEDCGHSWAVGGTTPSINDIPCSQLFASICKKPQGCPSGYYKPSSSSTTCSKCPVGRYGDGITHLDRDNGCKYCPPGRFGNAAGLTTASCSGECALGYYCPAGSTSSNANECPPGRYGATTGLTTSDCSGVCDAGYYCENRETSSRPSGKVCKRGRYGKLGSVDSDCSGPCNAGYYCNAGSSSASQFKCGGVNKFCPEGSYEPQTVPSGSYSIPVSAPVDIRQGATVCEPGFWCSGGVRTPCPIGRYGSTSGLTVGTCTGECDAGFYCPAGSASSQQEECGQGDFPASMYCPQGTQQRVSVPANHYSVPLNKPPSQRSGSKPCEPHYVCENGVREKMLHFTDNVCREQNTVTTYSGTASYAENTISPATVMSLKIDKRISGSITWTMTSLPAGCAALSRSTAEDTTRLNINLGGTAFDYEVCDQATFTVTASVGSEQVSCAITLDIIDKNDAPVISSRFDRYVQENSDEKALVRNSPTGAPSPVVGSDEDIGQELQYSITSGNEDGFFDITRCGGQIFVAKQGLDYETKNEYPLIVTVADDAKNEDGSSNSKSVTTTVVIHIVNVNEAPYKDPEVDFTTFSIAENSGAGTPTTPQVPRFLDPDFSDSLTYSIAVNDKDNVNDMDAFAIDANGVLRVAGGATIDYEVKKSYSIAVLVTDHGGLTASHAVDIAVINENDPPTIEPATFSIPENSVAGTAVGEEFVAEDQDVSGNNPDASVTFSIVDGNDMGDVSDVFRVVKSIESDPSASPLAARLFVNKQEGLDYETKPQFSLVIGVHDGESNGSTTIMTVNIVNVNEAPVIEDQELQVSENTRAGTFIYPAVNASDVDLFLPDGSRSSQELIYSFDNPDGVFTIGSSSGLLTVLTPPNFEAKSMYTYTLRVTDTGNPPLSDTATLTVHILDVNEAPTIAAQAFTLNENSVATTPVSGPVVANDVDAADQGKLTYSILPGLSSSLFQIDSSSGQISVANGVSVSDIWYSDLDFELQPSHQVQVKVHDLGVYGAVLEATAMMRINLNDVAETPYFGYMNMSVKEQQAATPTYVLGNVRGARTQDTNGWDFPNIVGGLDQDAGETATLTFRFTSTNSAYDLATDGTVSLKLDSPPLSNEEPIIQEFEVEVKDVKNKVSTGTLRITVLPENFPPHLESLSETVPEDNSLGVIGQLVCTDSNPTDILEYLVDSYSPVSARETISVNRATGVVSLISPLDYETVPVITLGVTCRDDKFATASNTLTITVGEVPEPPFMVPSTLKWSTEENGDLGTVVGTILVEDEDLEEDTTFTATQTVPADGTSPFAVDTKTGVITVTGALNYESVKFYNFTVTVEDADGLTDTQALEIWVTDINENPQIFAAQGSVAETNTQFQLYVDATDPDSGANGTLSYSIVSGNRKDVLQIVPDTSVDRYQRAIVRLAPGKSFDFEDIPYFNLTVTVADGGVGTSGNTVNVNIEVLDVHDAIITGLSSPNDQGGIIYHTTEGGDQVCLLGRNFGATQYKIDNFGAQPTTISVYYTQVGFSERVYYPTGCSVETRNTKICCNTAPGVGVVTWSATVNGAHDDYSERTTRYLAPSISGVTGVSSLPTIGGATFEVTGQNFGNYTWFPPAEFKLSYGFNLQYAASCSVVEPHRKLRCTTQEGFGSGVRFAVRVGGVDGALSYPNQVVGGELGSHTIPAITNITGTTLLTTGGGQLVIITGTNFGPSTTTVTATYGPTGVEYRAADCGITVSHTRIECRSVPGVGKDHVWQVTIGQGTTGGIVSPSSTLTTSYIPPSLVSIGGPGGIRARTEGSQRIEITGTNLGPLTEMGFTSTSPTGEVTRIPPPPGVPVNPVRPVVKYTSPRGDVYIAEGCAVVVAHTSIFCLSVVGTGLGMTWEVTIGDQLSEELHQADTGYHPPVVSFYEGEGTVSDTRGNMEVVIVGNHFGPLSTETDLRIEYVEYGKNVMEYNATDCSVTTAHTEITCTTVQGAGEGFTWTVYLDGQRSVLPVTSYGPPTILSFDGPEAPDTAGGQTVTLHGFNFGPPPSEAKWDGYIFLDRVTYGPTGFEYEAENCIVLSHEMAQCDTVVGSGSDLVWRMVVQDELGPASPFWSYAAPMIFAARLEFDYVPTAGGAWLRLPCRYLAYGDDLTTVHVVWNGNGRDEEFALNGEDVIVEEPILNDDGEIVEEGVLFRLPYGFGHANKVQIELRQGHLSRRSNAVNVNYDPPSLSPAIEILDYSTVIPGTLKLILSGENFCWHPSFVPGSTAQPLCGRVFLGEASPTRVIFWSHTEIHIATTNREDVVLVETVNETMNGTPQSWWKSQAHPYSLSQPDLGFLVGPPGNQRPGNFTSINDTSYLGLYDTSFAGEFRDNDFGGYVYRHGLAWPQQGYDMSDRFATVGGQVVRFPGLRLSEMDPLDVRIGNRTSDVLGQISDTYSFAVSVGSTSKTLSYYREGRVDRCFVFDQILRSESSSGQLFEVGCYSPSGQGNSVRRDITGSFSPPIWRDRAFPFLNAISVVYKHQRSAKDPPHLLAYQEPSLTCARVVVEPLMPDRTSVNREWYPRPSEPESGHTSLYDSCNDNTIWMPTRGGQVRVFGNNFGQSTWLRLGTTKYDSAALTTHSCAVPLSSSPLSINTVAAENCLKATPLSPDLLHDPATVCRRSERLVENCPSVWSALQKGDASGVALQSALDSLTDDVVLRIYESGILLMEPWEITEFLTNGSLPGVPDDVVDEIIRHVVAHRSGIFTVPQGVGSRQGAVVAGAYWPSVYWKVSVSVRELMAFNLESKQKVVINYLPPVLENRTYSLTTTAGGEVLTIVGDNFGPKNVMPLVIVGGRQCNVTALTDSNGFRTAADPHSSLQCVTPEGTGRQVPIEVYVEGVRASSGMAYVDYPPPELDSTAAPWSKEPPHSSGIEAAVATNGTDIIVLEGRNFGPGPVLPTTPMGEMKACTYELQDAAPASPRGSGDDAYGAGYDLRLFAEYTADQQDDLPVPNACLLDWNHTTIVFKVPEGYGHPKWVRLIVDHLSSTETQEWAPKVAYGAPRLNDPRVTDCDTDGRTCMVELRGQNLGRPRDWRTDLQNVSFIANRTCRVLYFSSSIALRNGLQDNDVRRQCEQMAKPWLQPQRLCDLGIMHDGFQPSPLASGNWDPNNFALVSHGMIRCLAPGGYGVDLVSRVEIDGQISSDFLFSYNPPYVAEVVPNKPDPALHLPLRVSGKNYGPSDATEFSTEVRFEDLPIQTVGESEDGQPNGFETFMYKGVYYALYTDRGSSPSAVYRWDPIQARFYTYAVLPAGWSIDGAGVIVQPITDLAWADGPVVVLAVGEELRFMTLDDMMAEEQTPSLIVNLPSGSQVTDLSVMSLASGNAVVGLARTTSGNTFIETYVSQSSFSRDSSQDTGSAGPALVHAFEAEGGHYIASAVRDPMSAAPVIIYKVGVDGSLGSTHQLPAALGYSRVRKLMVGSKTYLAALCDVDDCDDSALYAWDAANARFSSEPAQRLPKKLVTAGSDVRVANMNGTLYLFIANTDSPRLNEAVIRVFRKATTSTSVFDLSRAVSTIYAAAVDVVPMTLPTYALRTVEDVTVTAPPYIAPSDVGAGPPLYAVAVARLPGKLTRLSVNYTSVNIMLWDTLIRRSCQSSVIITDHVQIQCIPYEDAERVGPKMLVLESGGYKGQMAADKLEYRCKGGYYGQVGELCTECPQGSHCACEFGSADCVPLQCKRTAQTSYVCDHKDPNSVTSESVSGSCSVLVKDCLLDDLSDIAQVLCAPNVDKVCSSFEWHVMTLSPQLL